MEYGDTVVIRAPKDVPRPLHGLDAAFEGKQGYVIAVEGLRPRMYRVRLTPPVVVEGVGKVTDDLWCRAYLRKMRD